LTQRSGNAEDRERVKTYELLLAENERALLVQTPGCPSCELSEAKAKINELEGRISQTRNSSLISSYRQQLVYYQEMARYWRGRIRDPPRKSNTIYDNVPSEESFRPGPSTASIMVESGRMLDNSWRVLARALSPRDSFKTYYRGPWGS
jgi:hypothetical protein